MYKLLFILFIIKLLSYPNKHAHSHTHTHTHTHTSIRKGDQKGDTMFVISVT